MLIRGEAGIGKSALVELFAESYADTALFVSGSCDDVSTPEPLGPIRDIARLEPDLGQAIAAGDPHGGDGDAARPDAPTG